MLQNNEEAKKTFHFQNSCVEYGFSKVVLKCFLILVMLRDTNNEETLPIRHAKQTLQKLKYN